MSADLPLPTNRGPPCLPTRSWALKGKGAEGQVYMAKSHITHSLVALKLRKRGACGVHSWL